ncbi:MAG TPA: glycosyl transferase family 1, partial [Actinomycetota bacterium]|nr:glycosyl transferase family 1 [Actinomycetota bacterium]
MRVLHVFKDYYPPTRGGIEQHIHDVTHSLSGYDFAVLTSSRSRRRITELDDGVRVVRAPELFRPVSTPV